MLFASQVIKVVEIEGLGAFTIRKLSRKKLSKALEVRQFAGVEQIKKMGLDFISAMKDASGTDDPAEAERRIRQAGDRDPFIAYDPDTLIRLGVVSWPGDVAPAIDDEGDMDLNQDVEETLARAIYELSRPKNEAERKKD
jgi:hypothetical protein